MDKWEKFNFEFNDTSEMTVKKLQPEGWIKRTTNVDGDTLYDYYNKEGLFIRQVTSFNINNVKPKGLTSVTYKNRPVVFDFQLFVWYESRIDKLNNVILQMKEDNKYLDIITQQADELEKLREEIRLLKDK